MFIQKLSVFVENRPGRLVDVLEVLAAEGLDLNGLSVADTTDFGILRLILSDPARGEKVLKEKGFIVKCTEVLAVDVHDSPGGLLFAIKAMSAVGISVEYMYAFGTKLSNHAMVILKTDDNTKAVNTLKESNVDVLSAIEVQQRLKKI